MLYARLACAAAGTCCAVAASLAAGPLPVTDGVMDSRVLVQPPKAAFRPASEARRLALGNPPSLMLPAFDTRALVQEDAQRAANGDKRMRVGVVLPVGAEERSGAWIDDGAGGRLWVMDLFVVHAFGVRVHIDQMNLPEGATLSVQSLVDPSLVSGPFGGSGDINSGEVWSDSLRGGAVRVEYHLSAAALEALKAAGGDINNPGTPFRVADVVHMYVDPNAGVDRATPEGCVDVRCSGTGDALKGGVSRVNYVENGGNFLCTGELLNNFDGDFAPYYMTANHCFNTQASATSAEFVWNWYQNSCNGSVPDYFTRPRSRVATQLSSGAASDYSFMMIEGALPSGRLWQGFDPNTLANNSSGFSVHHPFGGVMAYAAGTANYTLACSANSHFRTNYSSSGTEPGSSGSGWYDSSSRFRGQLHCGFSHCASDLSAGDDWGRFDVTYPLIDSWLAGGSDDASEPNDTCGSARAVVTGTYSGRIIKVNDADWYSITVPSGQRIIVTFNFEHDYGDIDAQLYSVCGGSALDTSGSTTDTEVLDWSNYGAGDSVLINPYLYQGGSYPDTRNQYSMTIQLLDAPPQNDACANARVISSVPYSNIEDNSNAAADGLPGSCNSSAATTMQNAMWYKWTAPAACTATLTVTDLDPYDIVAAVYSGASCASLTEEACADQPEPAVATFAAAAGVTYWFHIGDWGMSPGGGSTQVQLTTSVANDACAGAMNIPSIPTTLTFDNSLAQAGAPAGSCNSGGTTVMQNDVWYSWTAERTCRVTGTYAANTYDEIVQVYVGSCGGLTPVTCGDEPEPATFSFVATAGFTYYFQLGDWGFGDGGGPTQVSLVCRPVNDACADALPLTCNSFQEVDLTFATTVGTDPAFPCRFGGSSQGVGTVWYTFVATGANARVYTESLPGSTADDTLLAAYVGSCTGLIQIACNDDINVGTNNFLSELNLSGLTPGNTYTIQMAAWSASELGVYRIVLECPGDCVTCPSGSVVENEACGTDSNGGCNSTPTVWQDIVCRTPVCGTVTYDGFTRDTDWYRFTLETPATVTWRVTGQVLAQAAIVSSACNGGFPTVFSTATANACAEATASAALPAGTYFVFAAPQFGAPETVCNNLSQYRATMLVTPVCPGDFNNDGLVSTPDLVAFIGRFGDPLSTCSPFDFNRDGIVSTPDLVTFIGLFGDNCAAFAPTPPAAEGETAANLIAPSVGGVVR